MWLTCADKKEADLVAKTLLGKHLAACVRQVPVSSAYRWHGKIELGSEVMILAESRSDLFDEVEAEVAKLHSYETFVLEATAVAKVSKDAKQWLDGELKNEHTRDS